MGKLTTKEVENAPPGRLIDGDGLCLITKPSGSKSWILRVQHNGKRRDIGLGSLSALGLADAREKARELRKHALNGRDPVAERKREKDAVKTFREATFATHEALKSRWVEKNAAAFLSSLEAYAFPEMGNLHVATITAGHIVDLLQPIWIEKPEVGGTATPSSAHHYPMIRARRRLCVNTSRSRRVSTRRRERSAMKTADHCNSIATSCRALWIRSMKRWRASKCAVCNH